MDELTRNAVARRPKLTEARLHQLELAFAQAWIKQPLALDALQLLEALRLARAALTKLGARAHATLSVRGYPERGQGSDDLLTVLDLVAEGLGVTDEERAAAPA
jgi:hypothetical protein